MTVLTRPQPATEEDHESAAPIRAALIRAALVAVALAGAGMVLFWEYLHQARTQPMGGDGAAFVLQAADMLHGNVLLHGWMLSRVSFYTTELPQYALIMAIRGVGEDVVHVAAAMTYTLLVLGVALLARGTAAGREGLVRALIAGGILLAPSAGAGTAALLSNADHTGTQVALLLVWLTLDRARPGWKPVAVIGLLLAWTQVADPLVGYEGVLPLLLVCGLRIYRQRQSFPRDLPRYELALGAVALASAGAAALAIRVISDLGGWTKYQVPMNFSPVAGLYRNLWTAVEGVLQLFGADFSRHSVGPHAALSLVHLAGVALAAWALARALRRFGTASLMVQVLAVTIIVLLAAYVLRQAPGLGYETREITGVLAAGAVLAGRLLAEPLIRGRHVGVATLLLACYAGALVHDAAQPPAAPRYQRLAAWLQAHHLTYGLLDVWDASNVTVDDYGKVRLRPVFVSGRRLHPGTWQANWDWFDPRRHDAAYLVLRSRHGVAVGHGDRAAALTFGPPAASYRIPGYEVLVWRHNLLPSLPPADPALRAARN